MATSTPSSGDVITAGEEAWQSAAAYLAPDLLEGLRRHPGEAAWIEPLDGTLLMADISGFTRMSERLAEIGKEGAEWLTNTINHYFESMLDAGRRHGGSNLKFGGDALLLSFTGDEHARRAVRAALAMQSENRRFAAVRLQKERIRLKMSIGAHSGRFWSAVAGVPGQRMQHFVLGEDACRVAGAESVAEAGEVVATPATFALLGDARAAEKDGMYRVLSMRRGSAAPDTLAFAAFADPSVLSYLPPPVTAILLAPESAEVAIGEHRKTTVIFLHVLGVEDLIESEGTTSALKELQDYVSLVVELAEKYGGFLAGSDIYNEGLKLILVFGAPVAREQDAANALRLSLELRERLPELGLRLKHRMGVNSGYVFAGDIGTEYRREYTVMGDAVNLAARLMSAAEWGQVLASKRTIEEAGASFEASPLDPIRVKGKSRPIEIGAVTKEVEAATIVRAERGGELVGREAELAMLREICREVEESEARAVALSGEPGIGKSRLTAEFLDYLAMRGWEIHRAQCQAHLVGNPFAPWGAALSSLLECGGEAPPGERLESALEGIRKIEPELVESAALLRAILSLPFEETEATRPLDDEARRRRLFDLVTDLIASAGRARRLAIVFEDVHWADHSSLQLLSHVVDALGQQQVMVLATSRTSDVLDPASAGDRLRRITLEELSQEGAVVLMRSALGVRSLPAQIASVLITRTRGNPLFLAEVARSLRESGELARLMSLPEHRLTEELAALDIPDRVQSLIMSRIDALGSVTKEVLRGASVLGATFDAGSVRALLEADVAGGGLARSMSELADTDLIEAEGGDRFRFAHALIQDVAYESLLYSRRRKLHERAGSYFEVMHWQNPAPVYETLVYHYVRAGNRPRALLYSVLAGEKARGVFANDEAIMHYERAAALAREAGATRVDGARPVDVSAGSIHTNLGDVLGLTGSESKAVGHYSFALRALTGVAPRGGSAVKGANPDRFTLPGRKRSPATRQAIGRICRKVGFLYEAMSAYRRAEEWFIGALSVLPRDSAADRALAYIGIAGIEQRRGSFEQSQKWCLRGIRSARRAQDDAALAHGYKLLGVIYRESGSRRRGLLQTQRALDTYRRMNDPAGQSDTLNNLGLDHLELGEWPQAVAALEECLSLAEKTGDLDTQAMAHNNLGEVLLSQGELAGAKTQFRWAVEAKQRLGYLGLGALAEANLGTAFMLEGRPEDAERTLQSSLRDFRRTGVRPFEVDVELRLAEVSFAEGKRERAQREAQKALRHAVSFGLTNVEEAAHRLLAKLAAEKRQWGAAQTHALTALRLSRRASAPYGEAKALAIIGSLYNQQAKIDGSPQSQKQAQAHYRRAINIFRRLGARLDAEAAERELVAN